MHRRRMLIRVLALSAVAAGLACPQSPAPPSAPSPAQQAASAILTVTGDVASPLQLSAGDLAKMPRQTVSVPAQDGSSVRYEGVPLREILARAGAPLDGKLRGKALASYVLAKARDGYQVVFGLGEVDASFANETILVADTRDGAPLPGNQGPLRLVCPNDKEGARSVRMLESLELVRLRK